PIGCVAAWTWATMIARASGAPGCREGGDEEARPRLKARPARDHFLHPQAATVMGITIVLDGSLSTATASAYSAAVTVRSARSAGSSLSSVRRRKCAA